MKKISTIALLSLTLILSGCENPNDFKVMNMTDSQKEIFQKKISPEDKLLIVGYVFRTTMSKEDNSQVTIGQALKEQKEFIAKAQERKIAEKAEEAKKENLQKELNEKIKTILTADIVKKENKEGSYSTYTSFEMSLHNKGAKDIDAIKGTLVVDDIFGDNIGNIGFKYDDGIDANSYARNTVSISINQFMARHERIKEAPLEKLKTKVEISAIIFKDGTKIMVEEK